MQINIEVPDEAWQALQNGAGWGKLSSQFRVDQGTARMWKKAYCEFIGDTTKEPSNHEPLQEFCNEKGIEISNVAGCWTKTKEMSVYSKFDTSKPIDYESIFASIVGRYVDGKTLSFEPKRISDPFACVAVTSDEHVGLNPLPNDSLFAYEYNADVYSESMGRVFASIEDQYKRYGTFDLLLLDDLGDTQDGWNNLTTRGGHELDQNMTEEEMFNCCVDNKVRLIKSCVDARIANKIIVRTVVNSNHSHQFALIVNSAVKKIINLLYDSSIVEVDTIRKFLEHRTYGNHCFILTHGKDAKYRNRGLPLKLDDYSIRFINDYINHYRIESPFIHVHKGDLHRSAYDKTKRFDYRNFMSFAPPSAWVQANFGDTYSGYSIQVVPKHSNSIAYMEYELDYKKKA